MKITIMVTDVVVRFRIAAIPQRAAFTQLWVREVFSMVEVAAVLMSLGFVDLDDARRLSTASTTIVPLDGFDTMPMDAVAAVVGIVQPDSDDVSDEAKEGHMLFVKGETTEEALAAAGFAIKSDAPVQ